MEQENCKKNELPWAIRKYSDEPVYKYVEPIAAAVDEEWLRVVSFRYPQPHLIRHYWQKIIEMFLEHTVDIGACDLFAEEYGRRLKKPKKGSLDWLIDHIHDKDSALEAIWEFFRPRSRYGFQVMLKFDTLLYEEKLVDVGGDCIPNEGLYDVSNLMEVH